MNETRDGFLGSKVYAFQSKTGFRAGTDTVLLAAAIEANAGDRILELGAGSGVGLLCLGTRVKELELNGVEMVSENANRANRNLKATTFEGEVIHGDIFTSDHNWLKSRHDHVFANPPFYKDSHYTAPNELAKSNAHILVRPVSDWVKLGIKRTEPQGSFTIIFPMEGLSEILEAVPSSNAIKIIPIYTQVSEPAKRVLIQIRTQSRAELKMLPPLILNNENNQATQDSISIAKYGEAIRWG